MMGVVIALLVLFAVAVFFYNKTLNELAAGSCTDAGNGCPHEKILETQNVIIAALILVIGILAAWIFVQIGKNPEEKKAEEGKPARAPQRKVNLSELDTDEKRIVSLLQERQGSVFQSDVIKLTGFSKVKVSRILDKMENSGLIERKRRGMTNLVVLR
jgi:uncharacterized membrane protein